MDYKALLVKYIAHLHSVEGANFIDTGRDSDVVFTGEEREALEACAELAGGEPQMGA